MHPILVGLLAVAGATTVAVAVAADPAPERAVVTRIVDGDTIDVVIDDRIERVRLLNIDTPETVDPNQDVECLGPEAAAHLAELVPLGSLVDLQFDEERVDSYGRTLAGVVTQGGRLVNAEMARAGLAVPLVVGRNDRFAAEVRAANAEAAAARRGLYSPDIECTVPARVQALHVAFQAMPTVGGQASTATAEQLAAAAAAAAAVKIAASRLADLLDTAPAGLAWAILDPDTRAELRKQLNDVRSRAGHEADALSTASDRSAEAKHDEDQPSSSTGQKPKPKATAKPQPQPAPKAKPKPKPKPKPQATSPDPQPKSGGSSGSNPYPGYNGPRCYAPGGKTWKPC